MDREPVVERLVCHAFARQVREQSYNIRQAFRRPTCHRGDESPARSGVSFRRRLQKLVSLPSASTSIFDSDLLIEPAQRVA